MTDTMNEILQSPPWKQGGTSDIYKLPNNKVLKLYHSKVTSESIYGELWATQVAYKAGLNVPKVDQKVFSEQNRTGLIFEFSSGDTFLELYMKRPYKIRPFAKLLAEQLFRIHQQQVDASLPRQEGIWAEKLSKPSALSDKIRLKLLDILQQLPTSNHLCHGDFHLENLLVNGTKTEIIDWCDASVGNPLGDLAMSSLILKIVSQTTNLESALIKYFCQLNNYLFLRQYNKVRKRYSKLINNKIMSIDKIEFDKWLCLAAAKRIELNNDKEVPLLLKFIELHDHVYQ